MMRRHFLWRFGCLVVLLVLLLAIGLLSVIWHFITDTGPGGSGVGPAVIVIVILLVLLGTGVTGRGLRRFAVPIGDLIDAASRVEGGDYAVRVPERAGVPRQLRPLIRSFNGMTARLEANESQRRALIADIGHELRTPLAVLQGELEAMLDGVHPPDAANLGAALEEINVLTRLVDDLRTLALADSGNLTLHREPTDLGILIGEVTRSLGSVAGAGHVTITADVPADLPLIDVDPVRIREVLTNLVSNALRFAPAGSTVVVSAALATGGRTLTVSVTDSGPGIPAELLPHVFERFAKSDDSRGSGLGLAIARQLVEAHGGRIGAESAPGTGTRMWFEIPIKEEQP